MPPVTDVDRREIEQAATRHPGYLYTTAALDAAAALLADVYGAASRHGVRKDAWPRVADLPDACLSVMGAQIADRRARLDQAGAVALLAQTAFDLRGRGIAGRHVGDSHTMLVPHTAPMAALGVPDGAGLVLTLTKADGWYLTPQGGGIAVRIIAPFDLPGATHVAALLAGLTTGHTARPDLFTRR